MAGTVRISGIETVLQTEALATDGSAQSKGTDADLFAHRGPLTRG